MCQKPTQVPRAGAREYEITNKVNRKSSEKLSSILTGWKEKEAVVVAKFFLPLGAWTWYVMEANLNNNIAYGITVNGSGECEYGYFSLTELQELRATKLGLSVERDIAFEPTKLADLDNEFVQKFLTR